MRSFVIAIAIATCLIAGIASQGFADVKDIPSEVSAAGGIAEGVAQDVTNTVRSLVGGGSGNAGAGAGSNAGFGTSVNVGAGPGRKRSIYKRGSARNNASSPGDPTAGATGSGGLDPMAVADTAVNAVEPVAAAAGNMLRGASI